MMRNQVMHKKVSKGTFKRLIGYILKQYKWTLLVVVSFMVMATVANVAATYMIQHVIEEAVIMTETSSTNFSSVIFYIVLMIILYIVNILATYIYARIMVNVGQNTLKRLRNDVFNHMMELPLKYFDSNTHGDLMSRYTNDVEAIRQKVSQSLPQLIVSVLTLIGYLVAMIITSPILAIVSVITTLILLFLTKQISQKSKKNFVEQQIQMGKLNGYIEEMIEGQKVVKVFTYEKEAIKKFDEHNEHLYQKARGANEKSGMLIPITVNIGYFNYAIIAVFGAWLIIKSLFTIPKMVAYLLFTRNFTGPMNQTAQQANFVLMALAGADRIFTLLDEEKEVDDGKTTLVYAKHEDNKLVEANKYTGIWAWKTPDKEDLTLLAGDVRFKNVTFSYVENKTVLYDMSLYAKPGQKIAFVGATGAGKTTITNLINRFYDVQEGVITYDGIDIKDIKKDSLRQSLGMVLQDTNLFTETVRENIRYGNLFASDEDVIKASKLANAHDFILKLPEGYDTILTDNGSNLSQGQRQLLAIARAAIANPPVLILDEATSSIDTRTEKLIQAGMDQLMENRTVFVIAHRLSTVQNSKAIIVLDYGRIIERGNHQDLVNQKGRYYQLYTGAFELE